MTPYPSHPLYFVLATILTSCSPPDSRQKQQESLVQIAGGQVVEDGRFAAVVEIKSTNSTAFQESCTGVFVAPQVMLTAAHCVWHQQGSEKGASKSSQVLPPSPTASQGLGEGFDPGNDELMDSRRKRTNPFADDLKEAEENPGVQGLEWSPGGGIVERTSCYVIPKGFGLEAGEAASRFDIAVVFWPEPASAVPATLDMANLAEYKVRHGESVTLLGYGWDQKPFKDSHILRQGTNVIAKPEKEEVGVLQTYVVHDDPSGSKQMIRDGDSGGPMLAGGKVLGIASALLYNAPRMVCSPLAQGGANPTTECKVQTVDVGYHVDVTHPKTSQFISRALEQFSSKTIDPKSGRGCTPRNKKEFIKLLQANPEIL